MPNAGFNTAAEDLRTLDDDTIAALLDKCERERASVDDQRRALGEEYRRTRPGPYRDGVDSAMREVERELTEADAELRRLRAEQTRRASALARETLRSRDDATVSTDAAVADFERAVAALARDFSLGLDRCTATAQVALLTLARGISCLAQFHPHEPFTALVIDQYEADRHRLGAHRAFASTHIAGHQPIDSLSQFDFPTSLTCTIRFRWLTRRAIRCTR